MPKCAAPAISDELLRLKSALERGLIEPDAYDRLKVELVMRAATPAPGPKRTAGFAAMAATILTMPALLAGGLAVLLAGAGSQILDILSKSGPG